MSSSLNASTFATRSDRQTVSLVGMPGAGKSSVGRQLAKRLGLVFFDTDTVVEKRIGCSIRSFFDRAGEDRFRDIEAEVVEELTASARCVIATGGGAVLRESNRSALKAQTMCFYLRSMPDQLFRRLARDQRRPLLQVADPLEALHELFRVRDPLYSDTARYTLHTGRSSSVPALVDNILTHLDEGEASTTAHCA